MSNGYCAVVYQYGAKQWTREAPLHDKAVICLAESGSIFESFRNQRSDLGVVNHLKSEHIIPTNDFVDSFAEGEFAIDMDIAALALRLEKEFQGTMNLMQNPPYYTIRISKASAEMFEEKYLSFD